MTDREVLADLVVDLTAGIHQAITGLSAQELAWRPDAEGNSIGVTVWHMSRGLRCIESAVFRATAGSRRAMAHPGLGTKDRVRPAWHRHRGLGYPDRLHPGGSGCGPTAYSRGSPRLPGSGGRGPAAVPPLLTGGSAGTVNRGHGGKPDGVTADQKHPAWVRRASWGDRGAQGTASSCHTAFLRAEARRAFFAAEAGGRGASV